MQKDFINVLVVLFFSMSLFLCKSNDNSENKNVSLSDNNENSEFKISVPDSTEKFSYKNYNWLKRDIGDLKLLQKLLKAKNYNDVEIRIWIDAISLRAPRPLFIFKRTSNYSIASRSKLFYKIDSTGYRWTNYDGSIKSLMIDKELIKIDSSYTVNCGEPKNGWEHFWNRININSLLILESFEITEQNKKIEDCWAPFSTTYNIEIITKNNYKFISYPCPKQRLKCNYNKSLRLIDELIDMLYKEFKMFREYPKDFNRKKYKADKDFRC